MRLAHPCRGRCLTAPPYLTAAAITLLGSEREGQESGTVRKHP